jgi:hypothetical protein
VERKGYFILNINGPIRTLQYGGFNTRYDSVGWRWSNTIQGGRGKAELARRPKNKTFKHGLNTCDFGGEKHIEHNEMNGFSPPLSFLATEFDNRVRQVVTCFAVLAYSHCSPPFADREWNEEAKETGEARAKGRTGEARAKGKTESALDR